MYRVRRGGRDGPGGVDGDVAAVKPRTVFLLIWGSMVLFWVGFLIVNWRQP